MWQTGGEAVPKKQNQGSKVVEGRLGGAVANISQNLSSPTTESVDHSYKSQYDTHTDSGFLEDHATFSGTQLLHSMPRSEIQHQDGGKSIPSGCLDSGIDISEQMSTMALSCEVSSECEVSRDQQSLSPHIGGGRNNFQSSKEEQIQPQSGGDQDLSPNHLAILKEIFTRDQDGDTQLQIAVMRGFIEIVLHVCRLLPHQALLDYPNNTGRTALHLAVSAGVPSIVRHLIVCGASPVSRDMKGNTPLHVACAKKDPEMVTHLTRPVTHSEVINARLMYSPTHTPGPLAADLNNYQGETCVHVAARAGDKEILHHLTCYGADINAKEYRSGRTALHFAVESRDPELVAHIVTNCHANITAETYSRLSPYQLALANCETGIATQLLDLGAPAQILPAAFAPDTDSDEDEEDDFEDQYNQAILSSMTEMPEVDDIRLAGVPVSTHSFSPTPVSTAPHTINADLYF